METLGGAACDASAADLGANLGRTQTSTGAARKRRGQRRRADGRHLAWLVTGLQAVSAHHTRPHTSRDTSVDLQTLAARVDALEGQVAGLVEAMRAMPADLGQAHLRDLPHGVCKQSPGRSKKVQKEVSKDLDRSSGEVYYDRPDVQAELDTKYECFIKPDGQCIAKADSESEKDVRQKTNESKDLDQPSGESYSDKSDVQTELDTKEHLIKQQGQCIAKAETHIESIGTTLKMTKDQDARYRYKTKKPEIAKKSSGELGTDHLGAQNDTTNEDLTKPDEQCIAKEGLDKSSAEMNSDCTGGQAELGNEQELSEVEEAIDSIMASGPPEGARERRLCWLIQHRAKLSQK